MRQFLLALGLVLLLTQPAQAQLEPFKDYNVSDAVWHVTAVKVDANMTDHYLEGIRATWVASSKVAKELGHIEDYKILSSELPNSGEWNLLLMTKFKSTADFGPNKARYDAFMKAWGEANRDMVREKVKAYPNVREITGEYLARELTVN
ncbi:hypothetical protein [Pseudomarimonas arenosa]|uniref:NIPSNAP protein n=1 Tax=Pseudomarimonas arenosa TaxID=2774145 RepID=A0AAW3ZNK8_9GAMM|nr:hypothetical protein [Pseudomarimonas arenosa]MBD8527090.1 hypothetical protein [Pseudomarimonas arenosa]